MKKIILMSFIALFTTSLFNAQSAEEKKIKNTIIKSAKAGDHSDSEKLASFLDDNFRIIMNQLFGSDKVSIMPKSVYLEKIESKEFGGDDRKVSIKSIIINGNTASAKVSFKGTKMSFNSIIILVKNENEEWKLISELPIVVK